MPRKHAATVYGPCCPTTDQPAFYRCRYARPDINVDVYKVDGSYWPLFEPHHYLKLGLPIAAEYFVGFVDGEPVAHIAVSPRFEIRAYRASRLVVMPEWQGVGVGTAFLEFIAQYHLGGGGRCGHKYPLYINTSHPRLCGYLRRSEKWEQVSARLFGENKKRSKRSIGKNQKSGFSGFTGYGGHMRATQGFKYVGGEAFVG